MRAKIVWSLDPGSSMGWAVFHGRKRYASGVLVFKQRTIKKVKQPRGIKYVHLMDALREAMVHDNEIDLGGKPDVLVYERGGYYPSRATAEIAHGFAACIELFAAELGIPLCVLLNWDIKKFVTGDQMADKEEMLANARKFWPKAKLGDRHDEADALHIGRAYIMGLRSNDRPKPKKKKKRAKKK